MASALFFKCVNHFPISEPSPFPFPPFWNSVQRSSYILSKTVPSTFITLCASYPVLFSFTAVNNLSSYMLTYFQETAHLLSLECKLQDIVTFVRLQLFPAEVFSAYSQDSGQALPHPSEQSAFQIPGPQDCLDLLKCMVIQHGCFIHHSDKRYFNTCLKSQNNTNVISPML